MLVSGINLVVRCITLLHSCCIDGGSVVSVCRTRSELWTYWTSHDDDDGEDDDDTVLGRMLAGFG